MVNKEKCVCLMSGDVYIAVAVIAGEEQLERVECPEQEEGHERET